MTDKTKSKILDKIEKEKIEPIPKSHFDWKNRLLWMWVWMGIFFWILFTSFLIDDTIEYFSYWPWFTHWFSYMFFLPHVIWLSIVCVIAYFAYKEFRWTKTWHRHNTTIVISILLTLIFIWSFVFFRIWLGPSIHSRIRWAQFMPDYMFNEQTWNMPEQWRMAWEIVNTNPLIIESFDKNRYEISYVWAPISPIVKLEKWQRIRLFWELSKDNKNIFVAKWIMPWDEPGMMWRWWRWKMHMRWFRQQWSMMWWWSGANFRQLPPPPSYEGPKQ